MKKMIWFALIVLSCSFLFAANSFAVTDVTIYAEGAYTDTDLDVNVYADIVGDPIVSYGIGLNYDNTKLSYDSSNTKRNDAEWYFGDGSNNGNPPGNYEYKQPENINVSGSVDAAIMIGGKLDTGQHEDGTSKALDGVVGNRILLGTFSFARKDVGQSVTQDSLTKSADGYFQLQLGLAKGGTYVNFASIAGENLDGDGNAIPSSLIWKDIKIYQRGDANASGSISVQDILRIKSEIGSSNFPPYIDCNESGSISVQDILCVKTKI